VKQLPSRVTTARPKTFPGSKTHGKRFQETRAEQASAAALAPPDQEEGVGEEGEEGGEVGEEGEPAAAAAGRTRQMSRIHWAVAGKAAASDTHLADMSEEQRAQFDFCKLTLAYKENRLSFEQYDPEIFHFENFILTVRASSLCRHKFLPAPRTSHFPPHSPCSPPSITDAAS
jgi:hypothetical protein